MPATLSVLAAIPDHERHRAEQNATEVGNGIKHVTAAVSQKKMLDQLAYRRMHGEYSQCPPGPESNHQRRKRRRGKDGHMDHLVEPDDLRPCRGIRDIKGNQLHDHSCAESPAPQES